MSHRRTAQRGIVALVVALSLGSSADPSKTMNGFALENFHEFWRTWHLVTVRDRTDSGELRFVYANDAAWETLQRGSTEYPDGAMFGKVGFLTAPDALFESSHVPTRAVRYQVMVMDHARFAATHGWGYGLFLENGLPPQDDHAATTAACAACHELAIARGRVFSQPVQPGVFDGKKVGAQLGSSAAPLTFETVGVARVAALRAELPAGTTTLRLVTGPVVSTAFASFGGAVNELQPALMAETLRVGVPAALVSPDATSWLMMYAVPAARPCHVGPRTGRLMRWRYVERATGHDEAKTFCL
jgi:hypothetical protein